MTLLDWLGLTAFPALLLLALAAIPVAYCRGFRAGVEAVRQGESGDLLGEK